MKNWVLLWILLVPLSTKGQDQARVDSLLLLVPQQKDSALIWTYRALFNTYVRKNPAQAKPYLDSALAVAERTKISANLQGYLLYDKGKYTTGIGSYLASYVKMGLNNPEISDILNVLPSSIHTSKYRLKQKLDIEKDLDFDGFIKSL